MKRILFVFMLLISMAFGVSPNTTQGILKDVFEYDQHALGMSEIKIDRELIDYYLICPFDTTAIKDTTLIGDSYIIVDSIFTADSGDVVNIYQDDRLFQCLVDSSYGDTIILDTPLDMDLDTNGVVYFGELDMTVDGSTTSQSYRLFPPSGAVWNINNLVTNLTGVGSFTINTFGIISGGLENGCVLKVSNTLIKHVFTLRDNLNFLEFMTSCFIDTTGFSGAGVNLITGTKSFDPATILLNGTSGHYIEFLIQDDVSSNATFSITAHSVRQDE